MEIKNFYKRNKIITNGLIMWVTPWLILFLSYPKSLYLDKKFWIEVLNVDLVFMFFSLIVFLLISILLKHLKKTKSKNYKPLLWIFISIYFIILLFLLFLMNTLSGMRDI